MSTVRRPSAHRQYIREVAKQTAVIRLQGPLFLSFLKPPFLPNQLLGFLFFGTITHVEATIRTLVEAPVWARNPFRFLVLDLTLVAGVDMSSAEALVRVHRLMAPRDITIVFCGFEMESSIGNALRCVGLFEMEKVEVFGAFNEAMECAFLVLSTFGVAYRMFYRDRERVFEGVVHVAEDRDPTRTYEYWCDLSISFRLD